MTLDEFKTWLNKLIVDKKGALPDLSDWKQIKENLDKVKAEQYDLDLSGFAEPVHDIGEEEYEISYIGYDSKLMEDLEYFHDKLSRALALPQDYMNFDVTFNGAKVTLENNYETKESEDNLNRACRGR
jgi:hypothetical protein